jgi:ubiquinone/menaquinone biosynthesis C-methylase UbiE
MRFIKTKAINSQKQTYFKDVYKKGGSALDWNFGTAGHKLVELVINGTIKRGDKILDIGSGPGNEAVFLSKQGMDVTGLDINPDAIAIAKDLSILQEASNIKFVQGDALNLDFNDETFDVVNDTFVFHHFEKSARKKYAREIRRVLKRGGIFVLRGFSCKMTPGSGPFRLTGNEILEAFMPCFEVEELSLFRNLPTIKRPKQWHWFGIFRKPK